MSRGNFKRGISLLYHGCYRSNHGINIYIYIYMSVGRYVCRVQKCVGGITWPKCAHAQSQVWAVKTDL